MARARATRADIPICQRAALSIEEAAAFAGIGWNALRHQAFLAENGRGDLPIFKVGNAVKIPRVPFEKWLENIAKERRALPSADDRNLERLAAEEPDAFLRKRGRKRTSAASKLKALI